MLAFKRPSGALLAAPAARNVNSSILRVTHRQHTRMIRVASDGTQSNAATAGGERAGSSDASDASDASERAMDTAKSEAAKTLPEGVERIYVGKGNYIEDDPNKYPRRDNAYTGGFAGGETGLKKFVSEQGIPYSEAKASGEKRTEKPSKKSGDIYVGKGRYVEDDKSNTSKVMKLSARDSSLVGGFAGGEVGLKKFVATGEVPFGEGRQQQSPLIVAGIVSILGVGGGILFTDLGQFGEEVITGKTNVSPEALNGLDENTKFLLEAGVLLTGVVASIIGGRALIGSFRKNMAEGVAKFGVLALFWMAVFIAAQFVLDSN